VVDDIVRRACGSPVETDARIITGEINEVHAITAGGRELIVRIFHGEHGAFVHEANAIALCRAAGLPVPDVLLAEATVCVETRCPGRPLTELAPELSDAQAEHLTTEAGRLLGRLAQVPTTGLETHPYLEDVARDVDRLRSRPDLLQRIGLDHHLLDTIHHRLQQAAPTFDAQPSCFSHRDYHPKHLLSDGKQITGLIDFERAGAGSIAEDIGWWDYYQHPPFLTAWLLQGLNELVSLPPDLMTLVHLVRLRMVLGNAIYYEPQASFGALDFVAKRLDQDLEALGVRR
jgi:aminoglycoside phosphotransferase (APT) family kinase protein